MKDILGEHFETVKSDIFNYLLSNSSLFSDRRILKALKIYSIDDSDEQSKYRQRKALRKQILESVEWYDLKWLSILLIDLIGENFEDVAYTLKKINYDKLSNEIVDKLDLVRRVSRLIYLYDDDKIVDALENLLEYPTPNQISTNSILWEFYHMDSEDTDYDALIVIVNTLLKYRPTEYTTYFFLGYIFVEQELYPQALNSYIKALEICQSDPTLYEQISWLYMRIADCLFNLKRYQEVIENTDHALQYYNKYNTGNENEMEYYHFIFKLRCRSYFALKQYQLSLEDANLALEYCQPENREAMLGLKETIAKQANK
jgi:tetratricopeptide (TPR) repeat protein